MGWGGIVAQGLAGGLTGLGAGMAETGILNQKAEIEKARDDRLAALQEQRDVKQNAFTSGENKLQRESQMTLETTRLASEEKRAAERITVDRETLGVTKAHYESMDQNAKDTLKLHQAQLAQAVSQAKKQGSMVTDENGNYQWVPAGGGKAEAVLDNTGKPIKASKLSGDELMAFKVLEADHATNLKVVNDPMAEQTAKQAAQQRVNQDVAGMKKISPTLASALTPDAATAPDPVALAKAMIARGASDAELQRLPKDVLAAARGTSSTAKPSGISNANTAAQYEAILNNPASTVAQRRDAQNALLDIQKRSQQAQSPYVAPEPMLAP